MGHTLRMCGGYVVIINNNLSINKNLSSKLFPHNLCSKMDLTLRRKLRLVHRKRLMPTNTWLGFLLSVVKRMLPPQVEALFFSSGIDMISHHRDLVLSNLAPSRHLLFRRRAPRLHSIFCVGPNLSDSNFSVVSPTRRGPRRTAPSLSVVL